jgi:hypothetical protein
VIGAVSYAEGSRIGAADAQQVADRFHLILNLSATSPSCKSHRVRRLSANAMNEGCHNASRLYHEIRQKGYTSGRRESVRGTKARARCKSSSTRIVP